MKINIEKVRDIRDYICKGCKSYLVLRSNDKLTVCTSPHKKNGKACPCSICLIKSMCMISCDELTSYVNPNTYYNTYYEEYYDPKDLRVRVINYNYPISSRGP